MKNFLKTVSLLTVLTLMVSCVVAVNNDGGDPSVVDGVDYTNYNTDYSIRVRNNTSKDLVAFKGSLSASTLIGGIPAHASDHGLEKNPGLFSTTSDFPLILLTKEQYAANKSHLQAVEQTPFTRVFAFYNAAGSNENLYEIDGHLGGTNTLLIQNGNTLNLELRVNGVNGPTLGYAAAGMYNTSLYLGTSDFLLFPIFKKYNPVRDAIISVYPKNNDGDPWRTQIQLGEDGQHELSFDFSNILNGTTYSSGAAWLIIDNQVTDTGVQLQKGGIIQRTATGIATINNGFPRTYQVNMAEISQNKYAANANINAYTVGPTGGQINIGNYDLDADKIYKVTVTGSLNGGGLVVSAPEYQGTVSLSDFDVTQ
jgi:hypothetical protein